MPLHIDEAGWWFNYTNTSWKNRFNDLDPLAQFNGPFHTLSTYLAKLTLPIFGQNGIGWRLPVIIFGLLNCGIIYFFIKNVTGSEKTARLGAVFIMLNPFLNHFSHESRSYVILFFLSTCSYLCLFHLLRSPGEKRGWFLLFFIFLLSYIATLSAIVFIFIFMASLWILKTSNYYRPISKHTEAFKNIPIQYLIIFSIAAALFFIYIVFYLDYSAYSVGRHYLADKPPNLIAIPDFFSTFLGYRYLDDEPSTIYHYPLTIFLVGIFCFVVGIARSLKARQVHAYFFLVLFITTTSFYVFSGSHIYTRTGVFLAPFLVLYQVLGLVFLIETTLSNFKREVDRAAYTFLVMGIIIILLTTLFIFGKFRNLDTVSGNPFEKARNYLKQESGPNDLIISSLSETLGGFYLGNMIREKNHNIYKNGRIDNIYYLAPKANESKIELEMVYPASKKVKVYPLEKFESVASYKNIGVRPTEVNILKYKVGIDSIINFNQKILLKLGFTGKDKKNCNIKIEGQSLRFKCEGEMACASHLISSPDIEETDQQFIFFSHMNDRGADAISYASLKSLDPSFITGENREKPLDPFPDVYMINHLVNNIDDTDGFKRNVDIIDVTLQKVGRGKNILSCMKSSLFQGDSLINGVRVFNLP
jgi:hypothetical protein